MKKQLMRRCGFTLLVVYGLWAGIGELWAAQQRSTSGASRSTSGASRGTSGASRGTSGASRGSTGRSGGSSAYGSATAIGEATVTSDPETRQLIVVTDDETAQYVSQVISNLDRPKPQVLIKVVFIELTHNNSSDIGVEGGWTRNFAGSFMNGMKTNFDVLSNGGSTTTSSSTKGTTTTSSGTTSTTSDTTSTTLGSAVTKSIVPMGIVPMMTNSTSIGQTLFGLGGGAGIGPNGVWRIIGEDYQVTLRAIAQAGKLELLSRPAIMARNNQQATINLGQQVPLVTNTRFDNFGNLINTVSYQSVGINLRVTPFITGDGLVEMIISPEISALAAKSEWVPISSGSSGTSLAPVINSRTADTVVVVPDGQTVIIGGLMQNTKQESESKIPLLGDIPYLGALFRSTSKSNAKTELLIFLTPKIVAEPRQMASLATAEKAASPGLQTVAERDLSLFLDSLPVKSEAPKKKHK